MSVRSKGPKSPPTVQLRSTKSADPSRSKNYPKSARHAKTNTNTPQPTSSLLNKQSSGDKTTFSSNIKPSSTRTSKYKKSKRIRAQTSSNVFEDENNINDDNDEKTFFRSNSTRTGSGNSKSSSIRSKSKNSRNVRNKNKKYTKDTTHSDGDEDTNNDLKNEFALPEFIIDHTNDAIMNSQLTQFEIKKEYNIGQIEETFNEFEKSLRKRKEECILQAKNAFNKSKYLCISIDIEGTHEKISQIGTSLGEKEFELNKEQTLCIDKLREIIYFEDHSTDTKEKLKEIQKTLAIEANKMEKDKAKVKLELAKVEPQLRAAKLAVSGIPKSSLDEFRALRKPAEILVDVVRATAILVGKEEKELKSWGNIKKLLNSKFIDSILEFDAKNLTNKARKIIEVKYLKRPDFTFERINQASTVAGPFVFWLASQIDYAKLLDQVSPIQREVDRLQFELKLNEKKAEMLQQTLVELGKRVKECRYEMMEMVRKIVKLQDDIKEARNVHAETES